ncbi:hypothetical protein GCM10009105_27250 [Dokdonella soli]|uniref:OmpR/PhoB-type domain-containing protein n=1 Tax=Dokdonella soli TaxID=529810 RepID=A0ABP3TZA8_9GAMM
MYQFERFRLSRETRELWREGERVVVSSRVFDCLLWLIEHRDRAVGRDELIGAIWGKADVADNLLAQLVVRVRRVISDTGDQQRMIRTVAGFGYRWVGAIELVATGAHESVGAEAAPVDQDTMRADESSGVARESAAAIFAVPQVELSVPSAAPAQPASTVEVARRAHASSRRWTMRATVGMLVCIVAAWVVLGERFGVSSSKTAAPNAVPTTAAMVLPVALDAGPDDSWMRLGLMSVIGERLHDAGQAVVPVDNVVAASRDLAAAPAASELDELARTTGAAVILQARANQAGGHWAVSLRTIRGREPGLSVDGSADDALTAARIAGDRMAVLLGFSPAAQTGRSASERELAVLLKQAEALTLSGRSAAARVVLQGATAEQRKSPEFRYQAAVLEFSTDHFDQAQTALESLVQDLSPEGSPVMRARALNALGSVFYTQGDKAGLIRVSNAAIALTSNRNAPEELGRALEGRATVAGLKRDWDAALADFAQARIAFEIAGDRLGAARIDAGIAITQSLRDRFSVALPMLETAAAQMAAFHSVGVEAILRADQVAIWLALANPKAALRIETRLHELAAQTASPGQRNSLDLTRAEILIANGQLGAAGLLLQPAYAETLKAGDEAYLFGMHYVAALYALNTGNRAMAEQEAGAALASRMDDAGARDPARMWLIRLRARIADEQIAALDPIVAAMEVWAAKDDTPVARAYAALAVAERAVAVGDHAAAESAYEQATQLAGEREVPADTLAVASSYASWLMGEGDLDRAGRIVGRVAGWADDDYEAALLQVRFYHALKQQAAWKSALDNARRLAGERVISADLLTPP